VEPASEVYTRIEGEFVKEIGDLDGLMLGSGGGNRFHGSSFRRLSRLRGFVCYSRWGLVGTYLDFER